MKEGSDAHPGPPRVPSPVRRVRVRDPRPGRCQLHALGSGQALASPVACGDTITHDTTLHNDLTNCTTDGLVIGADNITLDLNGHTIDGVQTGPPVCEPPFVPRAG
jgi:hypothetical protein